LAAWLVTSQSAPKDGVFCLHFSSQSSQTRSLLKLGNQNKERNQTIAKKAKRKRKNTMRKTKNRALLSRKWEK